MQGIAIYFSEYLNYELDHNTDQYVDEKEQEYTKLDELTYVEDRTFRMVNVFPGSFKVGAVFCSNSITNHATPELILTTAN